ncbi:MAG TPA: HD domain-containing protein [Thermomicrobiales bacterium]|nr:HD domain-containing protein [Thermomicrobiales bacterium]
MDSNDEAQNSGGSTRVLAGIVVADTPIVSRAIEYARRHSEAYLFNHVMRSWLFAVAIARRTEVPHDPEVLALATLLHDIGLANAFAGPLRFEVEGANAARAFARAQGMREDRAQLIWDGVALNSTPSIGLHKENEVALCTMGIGLDWGGWGYDTLRASELAAIVEAFPRLEMKRRFTRDVCRIVESRPDTTYDNFARDFGERFVPRYTRPSAVDLLMGSPFPE